MDFQNVLQIHTFNYWQRAATCTQKTSVKLWITTEKSDQGHCTWAYEKIV